MPLFPGVSSLLPCGVVALLIFVNDREHAVKRFFSLPLVVWIEKLSYSLYLWHWVFLAFLWYIYGKAELPALHLAIAVVLTFGCSVLTYYLVEQPIRRRQFTFVRSFVLFYVLPVIVVGVFFVMGRKYNISIFNENIPEKLQYPKNICHNTIDRNCTRGDTTVAPKILVIGDSHTGHTNPFVDMVGKKEGWSADVISSDGCPFCFDDVQIIRKEGKARTLCTEYRNNIEQIYRNYDVIIISIYWGWEEYNKEKMIATQERLIDTLLQQNKKVYLVNTCNLLAPSPLRGWYLKQKGLGDFVTYPSKVESTIKHKDAVVGYLLKRFSQIHWVDLSGLAPKDGIVEGKPVFVDANHWNYYGAEKLAEKFIASGQRLIDEKDLK
ncbi:hypothetical protein SAMN05444369_1174 [Capnocytophaga haemolytica]|uniref:O-acetyltransferase OatA n=2 Tax=Capnocytophaga haemolytica TaxID=45243 RepID=A0AAX2GY46_9FLAO|nr:acyltransferase family protein [Capnocytophaga haemolytica]AMD84987.1 hypothetical protein AXF12_05315 [Capnocytophaga haemolytica]SFO27750.1 hypothetical protein SAMN05444369_1174 [Capnocytophaga haemolytica]SNV05944.1 O-acetyltransferase OatA [Capnocytophaga haemolytica]